jgi:hypothetical protein
VRDTSSYYYSKAKVLFSKNFFELALNEINKALNNFSLEKSNCIFCLPLENYSNLKKEILHSLGNLFI